MIANQSECNQSRNSVHLSSRVFFGKQRFFQLCDCVFSRWNLNLKLLQIDFFSLLVETQPYLSCYCKYMTPAGAWSYVRKFHWTTCQWTSSHCDRTNPRSKEPSNWNSHLLQISHVDSFRYSHSDIGWTMVNPEEGWWKPFGRLVDDKSHRKSTTRGDKLIRLDSGPWCQGRMSSKHGGAHVKTWPVVVCDFERE